MKKFKYLFLVNSCLLTFMGAMLKLEGYSNYHGSFIAGMANMAIFVFFLWREERLTSK